MAKKRTKKTAIYTIDRVALLTPMARELGVPTSTLNTAVAAGYVEAVKLGCGSRAVVIASAKAWSASPRQRGPKANDD